MYNDGYADNCAHISIRDIVLPVANANDGIHYTVDLVVASVCIYALVAQRKIKSKEQRRLVIFCLNCRVMLFNDRCYFYTILAIYASVDSIRMETKHFC